MSEITKEISKRRTFAIISHPDAGKTTLTEKLLLFGGAIQQAGMIKAKKNKKYTTSDWMELEKQRGISVATSVMLFEYNNHIVNLLDTPGHEDFSEDTYRTLTAVDSVLMVIDAAKGVEARTKKLMDVCRLRSIPVLTFINKLDRDGQHIFELLEDIETNLNIKAIPLNLPLGMGADFAGVYDIRTKNLLKYKDITASSSVHEAFKNDLELVEGALENFSKEDFLTGKMTPVFFGSALNNFGIKELLDYLLELAPCPQAKATQERKVLPDENKLSGFIFKIHANMDPKHRDRIAFMRICSGKFTRGMKLWHSRLAKEIKANNPLTFMAQNREITEEAYPGDIIGLHDTGLIKIGDSFTDGETLTFTGIPSFSPEIFNRVINQNPLKSKQLQTGLQQLSEEGAVQLFRNVFSNQLILGAVGQLQFDVVKFRLETEYNAQCLYEPQEIAFAYWVKASTEKDLKDFISANQIRLAYDTDEQIVYLFKGNWEVPYVIEKHPNITFYKTSMCTEKDKVLT